jgi:lipooligosaccharide transport system permease protein
VDLTLRSFEYWLYRYRRTWRGSAVTSFLSPALYLAAMGYGLGNLVDRGGGSATLAGLDYLGFLAPGLLAATAMQAAVSECTWPVLGALRWERSYHAMRATPLRPRDMLAGHLMFVALRLVIVLGAFLVVAMAFGAMRTPWVLGAWAGAVLCGLAHATAVEAFSVTRENDHGFAALNRFVVVPLFLFSGTFFPVGQLPRPMELAAYLTPLWHGVDLCRDVALGRAEAGQVGVHVAYLLVWVAVGAAFAARNYRRRLEV